MGCSFCNNHNLILELNNEIKIDKIEKNEKIIIEDDLNEFTRIYPQKEENGIKLKIRGPIENGNENTLYYGEWDINKNIGHGRGIKFWPDGTVYIGYWKNGLACGKGKLYNSIGNIYEGDWLNGQLNGYGIFIHISGLRYEGNWKDNKQDGNGNEIWPDGRTYEGQYTEGQKNGKGKFCWPDGAIYE